jgi:type IV pilus assembly protein PilA
MLESADRAATSLRSQAGFTLVELLVVMLLFGVLAAIAVPAFFDQRGKAQDAEAKSTAKSAHAAMEVFATDHDGRYVREGGEPATAADLHAIEATIPPGAPLSLSGVDEDEYTVTVSSPTGNEFSVVREAGGRMTFPCSDEGEGGCPAGGWAD